MQFFTPGSSKIEVFETYFQDIVTTGYDHSRYVKHVLGRIYVFVLSFMSALLGLDSVRGGLAEGNRITSHRLLDQSQASVHRGKRHIPPHFEPFWASSRTLPQGVELAV